MVYHRTYVLCLCTKTHEHMMEIGKTHNKHAYQNKALIYNVDEHMPYATVVLQTNENVTTSVSRGH